MSIRQHAARVALLMAVSAGMQAWLVAHTEILFADGLRYIAQARQLDEGHWSDALVRAVDHPVYPAAVAAVHRGLIDGSSPQDWQLSAQAASALFGVLIVIPIYLVGLELFGATSAWLACIFVTLTPLWGHVFADALSESTCLFFWTFGLWTALRFLREGRFFWLPLTILAGGLSYWTRPEGALLPAALAATLLMMPFSRSIRLHWPRWWAAVGLLVIGPALVIGPYLALRGGVGTKPAVARLLGLAPKSAALAVERERPLDPDQSMLKTAILAARATALAVGGATSWPLVPLALLGFLTASRGSDEEPSYRARRRLLLAILLAASLLALMRLHATGGYCTPRHAMMPSLVLLIAAAGAVARIVGNWHIDGARLGLGEGTFHAGPAAWAAVVVALFAINAGGLFAPINRGMRGYRDAGEWIAAHVPAEARVVDVTGWTQYYSGRPGYTFATLIAAPGDPALRWVVVRDAHLHGPWDYCTKLRALVDGLEPVESYPPVHKKGYAQVYIYDRLSPRRSVAHADVDASR
ncbi:MAG: glycosyltransferase family 39 protein, partial [Planctomycetota bacterium]|nr:glycosyltransferase family 39 protein [Planctomycetota bacterium]